ncbi:toprim domain-containing protein [Chryseobacterium sp. Ch-15]|uniref:Toprim domain-containing protein n=1 Tax=Chryseobacterium muglaense TaxID=2893752 RepID=A0A9Q3UR53_9FLAO|nr:toprim domain-containing protein [Chryseobacterium muglaense]MBD3906498.1 toprim domain-containing protein [Chryseobacterium muglaense]MCC9034003.1 toprim domain-containing protein [Chryseobacterium muglaense]MCM2556206.1 toprim domain-containing protein [Chryseobacterium muglaense]
MNCKQFNSISLEEVLLSLGHLPTKQNEKEAWYLNPFAIESQASFKLDKRINAWYLHSEGVGGNNTDFMMKYLNISVNEVLDWAAKQNFSSFHQQQHIKNSKPNYRIDEILNIENPNLKRYLQDRGLSSKIYDYIKEVRFTLGDKKLYAIGFENLSGGFELRNSFYKGSLVKKDISIINLNSIDHNVLNLQGEKIKGVAVFEGFIDALSFIEMKGSFEGDILVMNSIALLRKSMEHLKNYPDINLFLDNDNAGIKCKSEIIKSFPEAKDHSAIYSNHKDLNEFLIHRIKNNVSNKAGKQSEKFPEQDKQQVRNHGHEIKKSNGFNRKR